MSRSTVNGYPLVPFAASHDNPFSCAWSSVRNFTRAVQLFRSTVRNFFYPFSRDYHPFEVFDEAFRTIRSKCYSCRSAVQVHRSKIFLAIQTWLPSVRNFSLAVQLSYQSVRDKLSAVRFHPFQTASWAVSQPFDSRAFHPFNGKPLVYVFAWEVTISKVGWVWSSGWT